MSMTEEQRIEHHIQKYMQSKIARDHAQEAMDFAKDHIIEYFNNNEDSTLRVGFDEAFDIKATFGSSSKRKFDKDKLAEDMDVDPDSVNRDFLIKAVDDRKLTFEKFTSYHFNESSDRVSIRLVQAEGK